jgi:transposase
VTAADEDTAIAVEVLPGQASDAPRLRPMLEATRTRVPGLEELVADKGFDGDGQRGDCLDRDVVPVIPNRRHRVDPWPFDAVVYRERNRVERLFCKLKQFRRVATRYEKLKATYLGWLHLTLGFLRVKKSLNVNRP